MKGTSRVGGLAVAFAATAFLTGAAPAAARDFDPREYGAAGDGVTFDTEAVQRAIDDCSAAGGGRVTLARGVFLVKPLMLKSGVELHLAAAARLLGSPDWRDYPNRGTLRHLESSKLPRGRDSALITADEARNIAITGRGVIDANGTSFVRRRDPAAAKGRWEFERIGGFDQSPPRVALFAGCEDVLVRDVTMTNQPAGWSYWVHDCDRVVFDRVKILADVRFPNNDGIHVNSSRDVSISNCKIETGDDSIVVRANNRALRERKVCERVAVANCQLRSYANCIRVGWSLDGTIRNCTFSNLVLHDSRTGIAIVLPPKAVNRAGDYGCESTLVENLVFSGIAMDRMHGEPIRVQVSDDAKEELCTAIRNLSFSSITARSSKQCRFRGGDGVRLEGFAFSNCRFVRSQSDDVRAPWEAVSGSEPKDQPGVHPFVGCRNFTFDGCSFDEE